MLPAVCNQFCPVTVCHADKPHYVVSMSAGSSNDAVVLENAAAVEQLVKQMSSTDNSDEMSQTISWITVHLPSDLLRVSLLTSSSTPISLTLYQSVLYIDL